MRWTILLTCFMLLVCTVRHVYGERINFCQGYHGGFFLTDRRGNEEAFRILFEFLKRYPQYRVSLEYEPYTLERMKVGAKFPSELNSAGFESPEILAKLRKWVQAGRIEIVGGTYTQPLWSVGDGESWIRQFLLGCDAVKKALGVDVKTYAAQEFCLISQLPQILKGFGFMGCIFRTPWAPWGNPPQINASKIIWEGPDGSQIEAVPRYAFDAPHGFRWSVFPSLQFIKKAKEAGIKEPFFTDLEDFLFHFIRQQHNLESLLKSERFPCWAALGQPMDAKPYRGKKLVFSGYIKTKDAGARLYIDARVDGLKSGISAYAEPCGEWERIELSFKVPDDASVMFPQVRLDGSYGEALFDNLSLKIRDTNKELLENGSFEVVDEDGRPDCWDLWQGGQAGVPMESTDRYAYDGKRSVLLKVKGRKLEVNLTTFGDYIKNTPTAQKVWHDPYSSFEFRWPWGYRAGELQKRCREARRKVEAAERGGILCKRDYSARIKDAWRLLLMAEHHDTQSCFPSKFGIWQGEEKDYGELCYTWTNRSKEISKKVVAQVSRKLIEDGLGFTLFNTLACSREMIVEKSIRLPEDKRWRNVKLQDSEGKVVPSEVSVKSRYDNLKAKDVLLTFSAAVPAMGYKSYKFVEGVAEPIDGLKVVRKHEDILVENEFYRLRIAPEVGLKGIYDKNLRREILAGPVYFAGYFPDVNEEHKSVVESIELETGVLKTVVKLEGYIGEVPFVQRIVMHQGTPIIEIEVSFDFGEGLRIGSNSCKTFERTDYKSDWADDSKKLRFVLPVGFEISEAYCDHQYDVRRAPRSPYWGVSWADVEGKDSGVALLFDRSSGFLWNKDRLELVLAYGGHFMFESNPLLTDRHSYRFGIVAFAGDWETAKVPNLAEDFARPLLCFGGRAGLEEYTSFWLEPEGSVILGAAYRDGNSLVVRLFNPYTVSRVVNLVAPGLKKAWEVDLRGRNEKILSVEGNRVDLHLDPKQILTLQLTIDS